MRSLVALSLLIAACAEDVGEGRVAATVTDPATTPAPVEPAPVAAAATLQVDKAQSRLGLIGAKVTAQHPIQFNDFTGEVTLTGDAVTAVRFVAQTASVTSDADRLTEHLKGADFLDVAAFPTGEFTSTTITAAADGAWTHSVTGNLTIRGVTKQVTFPATITLHADKVEARTEFVINRQDFGVTYPGRADDLVQDNVAMQINFVAPRA
jgi:polyisoprenoid-binding protein YceI